MFYGVLGLRLFPMKHIDLRAHSYAALRSALFILAPSFYSLFSYGRSISAWDLYSVFGSITQDVQSLGVIWYNLFPIDLVVKKAKESSQEHHDSIVIIISIISLKLFL